MKSLERRFLNITEECERKECGWSSYTCFAKAVRGQKFARRTIRDWFYKLVNPEDYPKSEGNEFVNFLYKLSNMPEDSRFEVQISPESSANVEKVHSY
jgi:hypothetical protein